MGNQNGVPVPPPLDRRAFLAALGLGAAALGVAPGLAADAPRKGGVLRVSAFANPSSLDPATGGSGNDHVFLYTIFDTLIEFDYDSLKARPGLAEAWRFPDPTTLVLTLRPGVLFHDGSPCDAAAVKFNLDRNRGDERSNIKPDLATVASVEATGPLEVTLKLSQPDTALPLILADRAGMMVSPAAVEKLGREHDRKPVGTGPWKLVSWTDNEKVVTTRNERYWKPGLPHLDGVELSVITEVNTGLRSVIGGQNDFVYFLSPQQKTVIDRSKGLAAISGSTLYCWIMWLNFGKAPLDDARVRRALNLAVDREAFNKAVLAGLGEPATTALPRAHWAHDKTLADVYPHDPDRARKLLAEAGHPDGIDIDVINTPDQRALQRQEIVQAQLAKAGIRTRFTNASGGADAVKQFFVQKQGHGYLSASTGRPDPSLVYQLIIAKDSFYNPSRVEGAPGLEAALLATRASEDPAARAAALATLQRMVAEAGLFVPLAFQPEMDALAAKVKNYRPNLLGKPKFEDVYLEG